jgi:hypothetical protein
MKEDMKNEHPATGCGINVLRQAFEANALVLKGGHGGNEVGQGAAQVV